MYRLTKICACVPVNETCVTSVNRIISLLQINLHFHATVITILLFVGSAILLRSLRRFAKESRQNEDDKGLRQLTVATLFLSAILIACALAHIITLSIWFYTELETPQLTIADEMLFIKVIHLRLETAILQKVSETSVYSCWAANWKWSYWNGDYGLIITYFNHNYKTRHLWLALNRRTKNHCWLIKLACNSNPFFCSS